MSAGDKLGGYVWAREGFELGASNSIEWLWRERKGTLLWMCRRRYISREEYEHFCDLFERGRVKNLRAVLRLGRDKPWTDKQGREWWVGKRLLTGSEWDGELRLIQA